MNKNILDLVTHKIKKELQEKQRSNHNVREEEQVGQLCNVSTHEQKQNSEQTTEVLENHLERNDINKFKKMKLHIRWPK